MLYFTHLFHRIWPWLLGVVLIGYVLIGMLGELLPERLPPMQLLRVEAPHTLLLSPQQQPTFTVQITNISSQPVTTCGVIGSLDQSHGLARVAQVISVSSLRFDLPAGSHMDVVLNLPRDAIPLPKASQKLQLSVSCTEPTRLEESPYITVIMSDT